MLVVFGKRLYELFEAIVIFVNTSLLTMVQGSTFPETVQEVALLKEEEFPYRLLEVIILSKEPAFVKNVGTTLNLIELSTLFIIDSLFN